MAYLLPRGLSGEPGRKRSNQRQYAVEGIPDRFFGPKVRVSLTNAAAGTSSTSCTGTTRQWHRVISCPRHSEAMMRCASATTPAILQCQTACRLLPRPRTFAQADAHHIVVREAFMIRTLSIVLFGTLMLPLAAVAQDRPAADTGGCLTQGANICLAGGSARLSAADGEVLLSRGEGFAQIGAGEGLSPGDRVLVKKGSATLALGPSCRTKVGKSSMLAITQQDGVTCATPITTDPSTVGADLPVFKDPATT